MECPVSQFSSQTWHAISMLNTYRVEQFAALIARMHVIEMQLQRELHDEVSHERI